MNGGRQNTARENRIFYTKLVLKIQDKQFKLNKVSKLWLFHQRHKQRRRGFVFRGYLNGKKWCSHYEPPWDLILVSSEKKRTWFCQLTLWNNYHSEEIN